MSDKYGELDNKIVECIREGRCTAAEMTYLLDDYCEELCPHRDSFRTIDARLQSLRKRGFIAYMNQRWFTVHC